jgi:hypothetical protein
MGNEHFDKAHEQLVEEYLEKHPHADWTEAYEKTGDQAYERMRDNLADMIDNYMDRDL